MRIVGGRWKGRALGAPADLRVRPTSDRVREAIFNVLAHRDFGRGSAVEGVRVLDLFAGTGALGLEALSRGAAFALFVEDAAASRALIRRNVEALGATGISKIWRRDAAKLGERPASAGTPFGLVFADPPYRRGLLLPALLGAAAGDWLDRNCVIVAETAEDETLEPGPRFDLADERVYGETRVRFLTLSAPPETR